MRLHARLHEFLAFGINRTQNLFKFVSKCRVCMHNAKCELEKHLWMHNKLAALPYPNSPAQQCWFFLFFLRTLINHKFKRRHKKNETKERQWQQPEFDGVLCTAYCAILWLLATVAAAVDFLYETVKIKIYIFSLILAHYRIVYVNLFQFSLWMMN